jgi:hypothetical protein
MHCRQLMLFTEIIALYSKNHTKHINTFCGKNSAFFYVKGGGVCNYNWDSEG